MLFNALKNENQFFVKNTIMNKNPAAGMDLFIHCVFF